MKVWGNISRGIKNKFHEIAIKLTPIRNPIVVLVWAWLISALCLMQSFEAWFKATLLLIGLYVFVTFLVAWHEDKPPLLVRFTKWLKSKRGKQ